MTSGMYLSINFGKLVPIPSFIIYAMIGPSTINQPSPESSLAELGSSRVLWVAVVRKGKLELRDIFCEVTHENLCIV